MSTHFVPARSSKTVSAVPRDFDHGDVIAVAGPEWEAVRRAIDALGRALDRQSWGPDKLAERRGQFVDMVSDVARTVYAGDCCQRCDDPTTYSPYRAEVRDEWVHGYYRCVSCGARWTCGYATPRWGLG